ncbi:hypothetical protein TYRP_015455 [Tyrophagus putrescentiae]|nr:hypothetical protein TYRP_015455 [Tyrophagus putrescentiae]
MIPASQSTTFLPPFKLHYSF